VCRRAGGWACGSQSRCGRLLSSRERTRRPAHLPACEVGNRPSVDHKALGTFSHTFLLAIWQGRTRELASRLLARHGSLLPPGVLGHRSARYPAISHSPSTPCLFLPGTGVVAEALVGAVLSAALAAF